MTSLGHRFATAISERDRHGLAALLSEDVDFKGLTPRRLWEASSPDAVDGIVFGHWFEESDEVTALVDLDEGTVGDTSRVGYRFDVRCPDGPYLVEQQAYYRTDADRITHLRIVCSGFRPR